MACESWALSVSERISAELTALTDRRIVVGNVLLGLFVVGCCRALEDCRGLIENIDKAI